MAFRYIPVIIFLISLFLLNGCKSKHHIYDSLIADLTNLDQHHVAHKHSKQAKKRLIPKNHHNLLDKRFTKRFLLPWKARQASVRKKDVWHHFLKLKNNKMIAENKKNAPQKWKNALIKNAQLASYPNYQKYAITIQNTNLRLLPTHKPLFSSYTNHSDGFPFDMVQNSTLPANTPIYICHITQDNAWVFIETPYAHGWIPITDIAYAGPRFIKKFKSLTRYVAVITDSISIQTTKRHFLYKSYIGMTFPLMKQQKHRYIIGVAQADSSRYAYLEQASIPSRYAARRPLPFTNQNLVKISNSLIDHPYGWGGLYNNRDCSSMIRDLFTPFGIWLPRNSTEQAKKGGLFLNISALTTSQKKTFIKQHAIPYATLLWFPGHIMLYIGKEKDDLLVFHSIWGVQTTDTMQRAIIGKSVITTLQPGKELPHIDTSHNFLSRIEGITHLTPRY